MFAVELPRQHPEFTVIGQGSLHGGSRSTLATVLGIAEPIRHAYSIGTGMHPSWFSANARGACPVCKGKGVTVTDLAFLDDVRTACEACNGTRFNPTALAATLAGYTIADALAMNATRAAAFFAEHTAITERLTWLSDVGLDYLAIGQGADTLSGGERRRLLLAKHLADTLDPAHLRIVIDEPTAGLHGNDIDRLLRVLDRLVDAGATIIAIEHNQRVMAHVDHIIDVGPAVGADGGTVIYQGPPTGLLTHASSLTGQHLQTLMSRPRSPSPGDASATP